MKIKKSKHYILLNIGNYDFGVGMAKVDKIYYISIFLGKTGIMFDIPYSHCVRLRKRKVD